MNGRLEGKEVEGLRTRKTLVKSKELKVSGER